MADDHLGHPLNSVGQDKHAVDPLEVVRNAVEVTHRLLHDGQGTEARMYLRRQLESVLRFMCPICGRTDDHEDAGHRFVAVHQRQLGRHR